MATLRQLKLKAAKMGYKMTPELEADLRILAAIPDEEIARAVRDVERKATVETMASKFQVSKPLMEKRLGYRK